MSTSRIREFIKKGFPFVASPFLKPFEDWLIARGATSTSEHEPIFIVGAPRTGSTILYQALTNAYDVGYIDNLACRWHRNLRFGLWLSSRRYGTAPHDNFIARFGDTSANGDHAPSECGKFWYRWLPRSKHFIARNEVTREMTSGIRQEVVGASRLIGLPLLFKNLNAGQRMQLLAEAFPKCRIIFIRRDPRFVLRSVLKARSDLGIMQGQWWSVRPPNFPDLKRLPEPEMCAGQIYHIEQCIENDLRLFPEEQLRVVHYQELDSRSIGELAGWLGLGPKKGGSLPEFHKDSASMLETEELKSLEQAVGKYPFSKDLFI